MGNRKISEFTLLTAAGVSATNDYLPINDVSNPSASQNSRITVTQLLNTSTAFAAGTLATGTVNIVANDKTYTGDAGGLTTVRANAWTATLQGGNALADASVFRVYHTHAGTGLATVLRGGTINVEVSSSGGVTSGRALAASWLITGSGSITDAQVFTAGGVSFSSTGVITTLTGFRANDQGHATKVTNAFGFDCADFTGAVTLTAAYRSLMTSGAGKWGFYADGTANNAFAGNVRIGSVVAPTVALDVTGALTISGNGTFGGSITTGTPASGTSGAWKLGVAAVVSPTSPNRTIELDVAGTIYYLHAKTTNN